MIFFLDGVTNATLLGAGRLGQFLGVVIILDELSDAR